MKEANVRAWQIPGHPIHFFTRLLLQGFFSLQADKMKHYSGVLCCSADQGVHVLSEIIINKGKKSRAAVP